MSENDADLLPDAVQWAEGMLLTPQHFQQNDIYWSAVLDQRLRGLSPHAWGVGHVRLDMPLLAAGSVVVEDLACIFPDGTPYVLKAAGSTVLRLVVAAQEGVDGKPLRICIAIPPRTGAMRVPSTSIKRYESVPGDRAVIDEMTGIADVYVDRLRPKAELYREHEVPAGYHALPLIALARNPKSARLEPTAYHPPMLRLGAAVFLGGAGLVRALRELRDQMWDKLHKLTGMAQADGPERVSAMSSDERMQLGLARQIASALPVFDAIVLDGELPPMQAYHALAQVVASMTCLGCNPTPLVMSPYVHGDCAPQFQAAIDYVSRKLAMINTEWDSLAFSRVGELIFARRLPEDARAPLYLELRLREGQSLRDVHAWLGDARLGSEDLMPLLRQRRIPGASWQLLGSAEVASLGLRSDAIVLRVDNQRVEVPQQGLVDCFRAGRSLLIQSESAQHMPAAVLLQHRRADDGAAGTGQEASAAHV